MILAGLAAAGALLVAGALGALFLVRSDRAALVAGTISCLLACTAGAAFSVRALLTRTTASYRHGWAVPLGELHVGVDPLSAFFLVCVFVVAALGALYGAGYLRAHAGHRRLAPVVAFYNLLVAAMVLLVLARDGVLFLVAWEAMSMAAFFLVTTENEREEVRRAGMTYLIASHLGVVLLIILFALLGRGSGRFDFDALSPPAGLRGACFALALVGFGTKAGFWPTHVWLPDAHPAAPSHVSAVMSGVMIKMGIYGLLRTLTWLGPPRGAWGAALVVVGAVSGVTAVLHALAQHDLKRLLAYHSVENVGIITLGIGVALIGQAAGNATVAFLGYAGALLHVLNHGLFKGLLFQGAGAVLGATGTREIDLLGGLSRRMPLTALCFLVGAAAISGLPPLNGFVSEWLIVVGALRGAGSLSGSAAVWAVAVVPTIALIGGLAAACFVKAYGVVFLGTPRSAAALAGHEAGRTMVGAMILGALACVAIGLFGAATIRLVSPAALALARIDAVPAGTLAPLGPITRGAVVFVAVVVALVLLRAALLRGRPVTAAPTWGCGYNVPSARMQYTGSSFAAPLLAPFAALLNVRVDREGPQGHFPASARHHERAGDLVGERLVLPVARWVVRTLGRLHVIQQGRIQLYLAYIVVTLVVLLGFVLARTG